MLDFSNVNESDYENLNAICEKVEATWVSFRCDDNTKAIYDSISHQFIDVCLLTKIKPQSIDSKEEKLRRYKSLLLSVSKISELSFVIIEEKLRKCTVAYFVFSDDYKSYLEQLSDCMFEYMNCADSYLFDVVPLSLIEYKSCSFPDDAISFRRTRTNVQ